MRAQYQTLIFPYLKTGNSIKYCIFKRKDINVWQAISGGGEVGETPMETAKRESLEEAGISSESNFFQLSSVASIPVEAIRGFIWGEDVLVIPEYTFGVEVNSENIDLRDEHTEYNWGTYKETMKKLKWDSNKTALWELNHRLIKNKF